MGLIKKYCNTKNSRLCLFLTVLGPGIIVMLADTDIGSIVTAAQSGAVWQYKLLPLQILLIPILYIVQELTIRLGLTTNKGYAELIKAHFGVFWAWLVVGTLVFCCAGAIVTEFSGIAGVGALFGVPNWLSMVLAVLFLIWLVWSQNYNSVEKIAISIGAFELIYLLIAWLSHPSISEILQNAKDLPFHDSNFLFLNAASIGSVIMPWMIFYQQSALVDKGLTIDKLNASRLETFLGAIVTQIIIISIIMATAATLGKTEPGLSLHSIEEISLTLTPYLGETAGKILFSLSMLGAALVATIVVSLTAAWSIGEVTGFKRSLQHKLKEAPWFYGIYFAIIIFGGILVATHTRLVALNITIEVLNTLLLPIVLGFLFALACKVLPKQYKLSPWYKIFVAIVFIALCTFGLYAAI